MTFPFVEAELEVHNLASVVPSLCGATSDQVLIRTNTLDLLYAEYCQSNSTFLPHTSWLLSCRLEDHGIEVQALSDFTATLR